MVNCRQNLQVNSWKNHLRPCNQCRVAQGYRYQRTRRQKSNCNELKYSPNQWIHHLTRKVHNWSQQVLLGSKNSKLTLWVQLLHRRNPQLQGRTRNQQSSHQQIHLASLYNSKKSDDPWLDCKVRGPKLIKRPQLCQCSTAYIAARSILSWVKLETPWFKWNISTLWTKEHIRWLSMHQWSTKT